MTWSCATISDILKRHWGSEETANALNGKVPSKMSTNLRDKRTECSECGGPIYLYAPHPNTQHHAECSHYDLAIKAGAQAGPSWRYGWGFNDCEVNWKPNLFTEKKFNDAVDASMEHWPEPVTTCHPRTKKQKLFDDMALHHFGLDEKHQPSNPIDAKPFFVRTPL